MKSYKGFVIDHVFFNSEKDIDEHLKKMAVERFEFLCKAFVELPKDARAISADIDEQADKLVNQFGFTYAELDAIENRVFEEA